MDARAHGNHGTKKGNMMSIAKEGRGATGSEMRVKCTKRARERRINKFKYTKRTEVKTKFTRWRAWVRNKHDGESSRPASKSPREIPRMSANTGEYLGIDVHKNIYI